MKKLILTTALFFCGCLMTAAQSYLVKGVVYDSDGEPIPGITVYVQETRDGALTDLDGFFTIRCQIKMHLRFCGVGYAVQVLEITSTNINKLIEVTMREDDDAVIITPSNCDYAYVSSQKSSAILLDKKKRILSC